MKNQITEILGTKYPIILGPMRQITLGEMAAAVSNAGGFGQVGASGMPGEKLRAELKIAMEKTKNPVGVNIPIYRPNAFEALEIAIEMGVKTITTSAGDPARMIERIKQAGLKVLHKVSSVEMAKKSEAAGVDGVIAMGFEAGGHIGRDQITTLCLIPQLADVLKIPIVAAGGIADARGVVAAYALGAQGVEMGTRFVATNECTTHHFFKEAIVNAACVDTISLGKAEMPMRVLKNAAVMSIVGGEESKIDGRIRALGEAKYVHSAGDADNAVMPCGEIAGLIKNIVSIAEVFRDIEEGGKIITKRLYEYFNEEG